VTQRDAIDAVPERQLGEECAHVVLELAARPPQARPCKWDAALVADAPEDDQVVIPGHAAPGKREHAAHALVRQWPVADQVAGAEVGVDLLRREEAERRLERVRVRMDVRNDPVTHSLSLNLNVRFRP
jgi:hypothetical protein